MSELRETAARWGLEPLVPEGGFFRRVHTANGITAISYLVGGDDFSALHRMRTSDEIFFFHSGAPLAMVLIDDEEGAIREVVLGADVDAGQVPMLVVPAGTWQGASSTGALTLVSTVVAPGFEWGDFELAPADRVHGWAGRHPGAADRLRGLHRS